MLIFDHVDILSRLGEYPLDIKPVGRSASAASAPVETYPTEDEISSDRYIVRLHA